MPPRLKSVGLALALLGSGACCLADTARGASFVPTANASVVQAQTQPSLPPKD